MILSSVQVSRLSELLGSCCRLEDPGLVMGLYGNGQPLFREARGLANLEHRIVLTPEMVFRIGSITKPFTAQAVMLLEGEKKLALTDRVCDILPDLPLDPAITVEHLLTHTSGLKNYVELPEWWLTHRQDLSPTELTNLFITQPPVFEPGSTWAYNNSGYFLLGLIIERLSGKPYDRFVKERITDPLNMAHTFYDSANRVITGRVYGYQKTDQDCIQAEYLSMTQVFSAGALASTVDDLAVWMDAFMGGKLLPEDVFTRMTTPYLMKNGQPTAYGLGWTLNDYHGKNMIEHLGSLPGFSSYVIAIPAIRLCAVVLSNCDFMNLTPEQIAHRIVAICLD